MTQSCGTIEITDPQGDNGDTDPGGGGSDPGNGQQQESGFGPNLVLFGGTALGTYAIIKKVTENET